MASSRDVRIALLDSYMDGEIDDDEFLVLREYFMNLEANSVERGGTKYNSYLWNK